MKTILVDAWNTFVTVDGVNSSMHALLENYKNTKIILTNATKQEQVKLGIKDMPYTVFSLEHNPDKTNPKYFSKMLSYFSLTSDDVVYFKHHKNAVNSAKSIHIETLWFEQGSDLVILEDFLDKHL